ncbi:uncharacterized protein M421DRAFT_1953 [Didymella exigua CBS 183.55]|uniref:Uncharacterized protein n=1 Tax=Didymella exigua CBS 183.55 TaxID=1150837 RepID=A0A6A5RZ61_9PLEO|nr:uncharacterized protein M421DRAFT_1953 [Didymella exigua CBS 183.55]KAF1932308.1 hypothetical protein M421DRAFT_1953 [Didymella exigua CBS 183.55]
MAAVTAPERHHHHHPHGHSNAPQPAMSAPQPAMSAPHGQKRAADGALDGEQRLSKRFDLLNLDSANRGARLYVPVPSSSDAAAAAPPLTAPRPPAPSNAPGPRRKRAPRPRASDDAMLVEDTPHRVYIHDLAAELSDTDSDSDRPVFLSDIEKHLSKMPRHVLLPRPPAPTEHNQMVLYNVPASLTLPADQDSVRKAIVDARQRIREKQASGLCVRADTDEGEDADAMDLD